MEKKYSKEDVLEMIKNGTKCVYQFGYSFKGATEHEITKEKALALLPRYSFGMGFYELMVLSRGGSLVIKFNEFGENDLY